MSGWSVGSLDELVGPGGWAPVRRHFGVRAFGVNAWRADQAGADVIPEHDEVPSGHEELYVVVRGSATFTVGGETFPGPVGTAVFVRDPAVRRRAVADEPGTMLLTVGAERGAPYEPRPWEENADVIARFDAGDYEGAKRLLLDALRRRPGEHSFLYNLACAEARLGNADAAVEHLLAAVEAEPRYGDAAQADDDLASLRDDPRFPAPS